MERRIRFTFDHFLIFLFLFLLLFILLSASKSAEICSEFDARRIYLDLGSKGKLEARNSLQEEDSFHLGKSITAHRQCTLELITCPSCIINIQFTFLNISRNCGKKSVLDSCGCDYVWIYEPPYEDVSGEQYCGHFLASNGSNLVYRSQTRTASINFFFSSSHVHAFTLEYSSERNRQFLIGYPSVKYKINNNITNQVISSPFFPHLYPRDVNTEYVISCKVQGEKCIIRMIFTDYQLSRNSLIEFFDYNGQRIHVTTGTIFRPPLIMTTGPKMIVRFYANGGTNLGFKASYTYILGATNLTLTPDTDCGGLIDNLGGGITMMNILKETAKAYDCFWIIRPPRNFLHLKTQIYLKVITFADFAGSTELIIRQGMTSNEPIIETMRHPMSQHLIAKQREHVIPINVGFYVSLKGLFRPESTLAIVYSAFNYKDCYSGSDYLCRNLRCIPAYLICDGFDHCGDNSDETTTCLRGREERIRLSHTPNFFFPKIDKYSYLKTATIIFVVGSLGLMGLIFALVLILYRINMKNRNRRQLQTHLQTINDMLEEGSPESIMEELSEPDEPPVYEEPPTYDSCFEKKKPKARKRPARKVEEKLDSPPPPAYQSLPRIEVNDCDVATSASTSEQDVKPTFKYSKRWSLQEISSDSSIQRKKFWSLDLSTIKLYNSKPKISLSKLAKVHLSDTHLLLSCMSNELIDDSELDDTRNLRRSVSIEEFYVFTKL